MPHRRTLKAGSLALALAFSVSARADDITLVSGSNVKGAVGGHVRGDIQAESSKEVSVKLGNNTIAVPTDQIVSIAYSKQPPSMSLAESRENAGALADAADLYKKAAGEASGTPFALQAALFHQANALAELALADPSKTAEAVGLLDSFVKTYPTGRHIVSALDSLARLQLNKGDYAGVEKTVAEMEKQPQSSDRAAVLKAKISAKKGEHDKAITSLDLLIKNAPEGSQRQREARLAKAESLAALKKYTEAEKEVTAVIKTLPKEDYQGMSAAYNTLGDCLRAAGKPKDALMAYLKTDVLFNKDKEQHPRALAQISQLWRVLKQDTRADEVFQKLKQEYPSSPYVASASKGGATP
ncbi:MAG: tetratricopeptide repeat protein [Isosphaeraceae bacterium]|nr:tetratricopeptide repeat protein [Isosphaeraceae bacterium]